MTEDEPNLEKARLLCDSASGIYVPQRFATEVKRELVTGVGEDDWKVLEAGPDHEHYWDAWVDVLDNSKINDPDLGPSYLYQGDGDLWLVPEPTICILGYEFKPMDTRDWDSFAGADKGSFIHYCNDEKTILIYSPKSGSIHEVVYSEHEEEYERTWTPSEKI